MSAHRRSAAVARVAEIQRRLEHAGWRVRRSHFTGSTLYLLFCRRDSTYLVRVSDHPPGLSQAQRYAESLGEELPATDLDLRYESIG